MCPRNSGSQDNNYQDLKHFTGPAVQRTRPDIIVKSDAAPEIVGAVRELGWHPEPSLANKWPHNAVHERWVGTVKSVTRAAMLQSGCPQDAVTWALPYASVALAIDQPAPIHAHEKDGAGNVLAGFEHKLKRSCWQEHHGGQDFPGLTPMFGQLCFYLNREGHTCMPQA